MSQSIVSLQEPAVCSFDAQSRQNPCSIRPGVDPNSIGADLHPIRYGVTVNDDISMITLVFEKRFADPPQVRVGLVPERRARPHASVHEKISPEAHRISEAA
jgi:hypothetical protein